MKINLNLKIFLPAVFVMLLIIIIFFIIILSKTKNYTNEQIVDAVFLAEGGNKAEYYYGIRSIPYSDINEARQICFNTVRNNRKRFLKQTKYKNFLEFLASRYCPIGAKNDPKGLNKYWLKNVKHFLQKKT